MEFIVFHGRDGYTLYPSDPVRLAGWIIAPEGTRRCRYKAGLFLKSADGSDVFVDINEAVRMGNRRENSLVFLDPSQAWHMATDAAEDLASLAKTEGST